MKNVAIVAVLLAAIGGSVYYFKYRTPADASAQAPAAQSGETAAQGAAAAANGAQAAKTAGPNTLLDSIPADTVFFMGTLQPMPFDDNMAKLYQYTSGAAKDLNWKEMMDIDENAGGTDGGRFAAQLYVRYLTIMFDFKAFMKSFGLPEQLHYALYTVQGTPVLRMQIADEAALRKELAAVEEQAKAKGQVQKLGEVEYRSYPLSESESGPELIWALHKGVWTLTVQAPAVKAQALPIVLGTQAPAKSLNAAGTLQEMTATYKFLPLFLGYINHQELMKALTNPADKRIMNIAALFGEDTSEEPEFLKALRTPVCQKEFGEIAALWPRSVMGYTKWDAEKLIFDGEFIIESKADGFLQDLSKLRGHIPSYLSPKTQAVFSMALGLKVKQLSAFMQSVQQRLTATPYECPPLAEFQAGAREMQLAQMQMAMSMVPEMSGVSTTVYDLALETGSGSPTPKLKALSAIVTLSAEDPKVVLDTAKMFWPQAAMLLPSADGTLASLPLPPGILPNGAQAKAGVLGKHLAIFTGPEAEQLSAGLKSEGIDANGLLYMQVDYGKYFGSIMDGMIASADPEIMDDEARKMMTWLRSMNINIVATLDTDARGIVVYSRTTVSPPSPAAAAPAAPAPAAPAPAQ